MLRTLVATALTLTVACALARKRAAGRRRALIAACEQQVLGWQRRLDFTLLSGRAPPGLRTHLAVMPDALGPPVLAVLREAALREAVVERSLVPGHKQGGTIAYDALWLRAPELVAFYRSTALARLVTAVTGVAVQCTPVKDQSSCSVLVYERAGDRIGWHRDLNFYRGRHFTVLLSLENRGDSGDALSSATLQVAGDDGGRDVPTPANTLLVFEGARLRHRVTALAAGERRVLLSMTFCTDTGSSLLADLARRLEDTACFGPRALWN